jgi:hypothetical protein
MVMVWALPGFPGGTWQIVTLGCAAWAEALPSPSFAAAVSTAVVGLDCLSALQPKSANVTAHITDNHPAVRLFISRPSCFREDGLLWSSRLVRSWRRSGALVPVRDRRYPSLFDRTAPQR